MSGDTQRYLEFLVKVEVALDEALDSGGFVKGRHRRDELESMRREVTAVRRALDVRASEAMPAVVSVR